MTFFFGKRSLELLKEIEPELVKLCHAVIECTPVDFGIVQGERTVNYQKALHAQGRESLSLVNSLRAGVNLGPITAKENERTVTNTMKSNHLEGANGKGCAIDFGVFVNGQYVNGDTPEEQKLYIIVASVFKQRANEMGIAIRCGCDWTQKDYGHIELS